MIENNKNRSSHKYCSECKGLMTVTKIIQDDIAEEGAIECEVDCPFCNGTGWIKKESEQE